MENRKNVYLRNDIKIIREIESKKITPKLLRSASDIVKENFDYKEHRFIFHNQEYQDIWDSMIDKFFDHFKVPYNGKRTGGLAIGNKILDNNSSSTTKAFPLYAIFIDYFIYVKPENWKPLWVNFIRRTVINPDGHIYGITSHGHQDSSIEYIFKCFVDFHCRKW